MATLPIVFDYVMNEFNFVLVFYYFYKTTHSKIYRIENHLQTSD